MPKKRFDATTTFRAIVAAVGHTPGTLRENPLSANQRTALKYACRRWLNMTREQVQGELTGLRRAWDGDVARAIYAAELRGERTAGDVTAEEEAAADESLETTAAGIEDDSTEGETMTTTTTAKPAGLGDLMARAAGAEKPAATVQVHANGHSADAAQLLQQALAMIAASAKPQVSREEVAAIVAQEIKRHMSDIPAQVIEVRQDGDLIGRVEGHQHPKFAMLMKAATARGSNGFFQNIWIAGPAGSGKTHAVQMIAKAFQKEFEHNGALAMPHELLGFIDAAGTYHSTAFRRAYELGGDYLFDEVDGSDNAALLALNAALANSAARFPDATIERHTDCRIFAAANTWGLGATAEFVGRAKIDGAFLDRFPVRIFWDYDEKLETAISGNPDFARRVQKARAKAKSAGLKVTITPRASIAGAALIAAGFTPDEAAEATYLANLGAEQRRQIEG